jgi:hypothetical protein
MSGTASRFIGRYGYDPILRVGMYPAPLPPAAPAPVPQGVSPVRAMPAAVAAPMQAPAPVMAGSMRDDRLPTLDGAGSSAQPGYGGPGPSGALGTGNFGADLMSLATDRDAQTLAAGILGGPMGLVGTVAGAMLSGAVPSLSGAFGLSAPIGYDPALGSSANEQAGISPEVSAAHDLGHDMGVGGGGNNDATAGADPGGHEGGHNAGVEGGNWQKGGYTGPGHPAEPAGTVHKNEVVIPAPQVARYGLDPLLMLARGQVSPSRLSALIMG